MLKSSLLSNQYTPLNKTTLCDRKYIFNDIYKGCVFDVFDGFIDTFLIMVEMEMMMDQTELLFPFENIREIQDELINKIYKTVSSKKNLIVHAPTGIGKTVATLAPVLSYAIKNNLDVFFLTSRQTQHKIVIETLKAIKQRHNLNLVATSIIGKQWMCSQPGANVLPSGEFHEYCRAMVNDSNCEFYNNTKKSTKLTVSGEKVLGDIKLQSPCSSEDIIELSAVEKLCPYEMAIATAKDSKVIVSDYYYLFSPSIRKSVLNKIDKRLDKTIIIIDEGHNLPNRIRALLTHKISNITIKKAIKEAKQNQKNDIIPSLNMIQDALNDLSHNINNEKSVAKNEFIEKISNKTDYHELIADLAFVADEIREEKKTSQIGNIAAFLESWLGPDEAFARILSVDKRSGDFRITLSYRCLDPSIISKEIIDNAHSTILMSGTLTPTSMYKDLLGFDERTEEVVFGSPFPKKNRLNLVITDATTKFTERSEEQYKAIAEICANVVNNVNGCSAIFFPSYAIRDTVYKYFSDRCKKTTFLEDPRAHKNERNMMLDNFKSYKDSGAVLLGVASGSFGEGIDMPGILKSVIVVGLPLQQPNLEINELMQYYDKKFGKGFEYGYVLPAITKTMQNAGRCIRSEKDKGVIVFLDSRYAWSTYAKCFPPDWNMHVSKNYLEEIKDFFN